MDAGHHRVGKHLGRFGSGPAANERVDRFVRRAAAPPEPLQEKVDLSTPAEQIAGKKIEQARGQSPQPAIEKEVAVLAGNVAGGDEGVRQTEISTELRGGWLVVEEAVRSRFDLETVTSLGPGIAADSVALFENRDFRRGASLLEAKSRRQPRDTTPDDDDAGHGSTEPEWTDVPPYSDEIISWFPRRESSLRGRAATAARSSDAPCPLPCQSACGRRPGS